MFLVLENEVEPDSRYFVPEIVRHLQSAGADVTVYEYPENGRQPQLDDVEGVIVGGSTAGVYEMDEHPWMNDQRAFVRDIVSRQIPALGICFGHQLINHTLGGSVEHRGLHAELTHVDLHDDPLFDEVAPTIPAVHGDVVTERGSEMTPIASTDDYTNFATRHRNAPVWTVQYHPEFTRRLKPQIEADFGWNENHLSFTNVTASNTLANFVTLATEYTKE